MANQPLDAVLQQIRTLAGARQFADTSDRALLERFLAGREEAAFVALLRRHGPMVFHVCRRILSNEHDAEDTFQATFLLLARKASTIRKQGSVASWLYGVAHRLALAAKRQSVRRQARERRAADMRNPSSVSHAWQELQAVLDEALRKVPEKYRTPLLLCYLEGKTQEEAAHHLGCPLGTVRSRLDRGRTWLREELEQRGIRLAAPALTAALVGGSASATVPPILLRATARAALDYAAGAAPGALVSTQVVTILEEGLKAMTTMKLKIATAVIVAAGALGAALAPAVLSGPPRLPVAVLPADWPQPGALPQAGVRDPAAKAPEPVEVRFTDSSSLRLMLREERVEVITRYGRLTIPLADVRRIEFATRVPDDIARRVESAVKDLGDPQPKVRDDASAVLRGFREKAYPALVQAAKSGNAEVARRAEELLDWLRENVPADRLEVRPQDVVQTEDMKILGWIESLVFKANTAHFGEQTLKLADLRSLRALSASDDVAAKNILADPGTLSQFENQIGKVLYIRVTGGGAAAGQGGRAAVPNAPPNLQGFIVRGGAANHVWGTDVYTTDSHLATTAVHAGAVQPGETAVVKVTIVPSPNNFAGSTRHGVTTDAYGPYPAAFTVKRLAAPEG